MTTPILDNLVSDLNAHSWNLLQFRRSRARNVQRFFLKTLEIIENRAHINVFRRRFQYPILEGMSKTSQ